MRSALWRLVCALSLLAGSSASAVVTIDWVFVGNPGNAADTPTNCAFANCGSVGYEYDISKYEVTNAQYAEFLNLKAASDPHGLYSENMAYDSLAGGITQSGVPGSYSYALNPGFGNKPVNWVDFVDMLRFTNWLNNGQGNGDTETGAYTMSDPFWTRNPGAIIALPSENEWYKAAYYDPLTATYFDYPAGTNTQTVCAEPTATPNQANCEYIEQDPTERGPTDVGSYTGSASPYGTFDQGGNLWERSDDSPQLLRGGAWPNSGAEYLAASSFLIHPHTSGNFDTGFRVVSLPEPGSFLQLAAGAATLLCLTGWRRARA